MAECPKCGGLLKRSIAQDDDEAGGSSYCLDTNVVRECNSCDYRRG